MADQWSFVLGPRTAWTLRRPCADVPGTGTRWDRFEPLLSSFRFLWMCVSEWFSRLQVWKCVILATDENVLFSVAWRVSGDVKTWYDVIKLNYLSVLLTGCCLFGKLLIDTVLMVVLLQAVLDSLLLTSVSQLSSKIRQSVDKTAGKIRSVEEL